MDKDQIDELKRLADPLVKFLRKNHHPHASIVITDERVVVTEDVIGIPLPIEDEPMRL